MKRLLLDSDIPLDSLSLPEIPSLMESWISSRTSHQLITLNSLMLHAGFKDPQLRRVIAQAHCVLTDSMGIALACWFLTGSRPPRLPGIDLVQILCALAEKKNWSLYLLGSRPGIAEAASENLKKKHPRLRILGARHGYFSPQEEAGVLLQIRQARPEILLTALEIPRQEKWIALHLKELQVPVVIGVGGSLDILSGKLRRAPLGMRKIGFEWAFRLWQEPFRIRRVAHLVPFFFQVLRLKLHPKP